MVIWIKIVFLIHFSLLISKTSILTLAISYLTLSNLPQFGHLSDHMDPALSNSIKLWTMQCRATKDSSWWNVLTKCRNPTSSWSSWLEGKLWLECALQTLEPVCHLSDMVEVTTTPGNGLANEGGPSPLHQQAYESGWQCYWGVKDADSGGSFGTYGLRPFILLLLASTFSSITLRRSIIVLTTQTV